MNPSKYLSAAILALTLVTAVGCSSSSKQESTGEYVDDSVITSKVKSAILGDPATKVAEISVETYKGVVSVKNDMRIK